MSRHMCIVLCVAALAVVFQPCGNVQAQAKQSLDLHEALALAAENNRLLTAARYRIAEAEGDLTGASLLLLDNPEVSVAAGPRYSSVAGSPRHTDVEIGLSQRIPMTGQRSARIKRATAGVLAAQADVRDAERVVALAAAGAFYRALAADERTRLTEDTKDLAAELYDVARLRLEQGAGTPLELNTARIRLAETQRRTLQVRVEHQTWLIRITELLGLPFDTALELQGDLPAGRPSPPVEALVDQAMTSRPDIVATTQLIDAARAGVDLAKAVAWPDLLLGAGFSREEDDHTVVGGISLELPFFNRNQGGRAGAEARRARLESELKALQRVVEAEVRRAYATYQQAKAGIDIYNTDVLHAQEENLRLLRVSFQAGEVAYPDVVLLQRELLDGREGYLAARLELALAELELRTAAFLPLTNTAAEGDAQ